MSQPHDASENLCKHNAMLYESVALHSGIQLAAWLNERDAVTQYYDRHTLSLYIADGYESYHKTAGGWKNGEGSDHFCPMLRESESSWDIRDNLSFARLYCADVYLHEAGERVWDRSPYNFTLDGHTSGSDPGTTAAYHQFLLGNDWQQSANHLMLCTASSLLLTYLIQRYSNMQWRLSVVAGRLMPATLRDVLVYVEAHLVYPVTLSDLVGEAALSEFRFARMLCQSVNMTPRQYVVQRRMVLV